MSDFKLRSVAKQVGIEVDESKLHDAQYDIELTYQIYLKVKK
jgi:DNA polymerase-3 subunit epsilon